MQFTVPQFIEREPPIIGPITLRQFIYIGSGGMFLIIFWFSYAKNNILIFLLVAFPTAAVALALAFLRIGGLSLPTVIKNVFMFYLNPQLYLWHKKETPGPRLVMRRVTREKPKKKEDEGPTLKFVEKSHLKNLAKNLETKL